MAERKVLIPLDGSEFSRQIVTVVRNFFDPKDVLLVLFRAAFAPSVPADVVSQDSFVGGMPVTGGYDAYNRALETNYASVEQERESFRSELVTELRVEAERLRAAGYTVTTEVHFGDPSQRIIDFVNESDIDLVAMATHGRTGIGRLVLGSVAERVLRGVSVPVLLMRTVQSEETTESPGDQLARSLGSGQSLTIAVATDGSTHGQHALNMAATLAKPLDADLKMLVSVSEREGAANAQKIMEAAIAQVANVEPRPEAVPLVGYPDEEVLQYVAGNPVDLLVMGAFHDRGASTSVAIGPTAQRVVQHAPTSVLMVKGRPRPIRRVLACAAVDDDVAVDVAAQLARALDADLKLLHVVPPSAATYLASSDGSELDLDDVLAQGTRLSEVLKTWISKVEKQGFDQDAVIVRKGNVPEAILEVIHDQHHDLLVVGSQSGPGHFLGSVSNAVVRFADQSVLIVRTRG